MLAVIGGSGVYEIEGIKIKKKILKKTPFGYPSDRIFLCELQGVDFLFLPRHGVGHRIMPTELNNRANIFALKTLGATEVVSISACGSLKESIKPRQFILPDQIFDRTTRRHSTFFGDGIVAHISFANPYCSKLMDIVYDTARKLNIDIKKGGTYVCIEGPMFSTKAESYFHRKMGFDIIGMTAVPEAKLAREAELCYVTVGLVTDYDVWKEVEVSVKEVLSNVKANVENVKRLLKALIIKFKESYDCECKNAAKDAVQTNYKYINREKLEALKPLYGKYYKMWLKK